MKKSKAKKAAKPKKTPKGGKSVVKTKNSPYYAQSKRLGFRLLQPSDEALYVELYMDANALEFVHAPLSKERAERSFKKAVEVTRQKPFQRHISVIIERATKKPIGITGLKLTDPLRRVAEGGILLKPTAHAQRFASESAAALTNEAFKWHAIEELHAQVPIGHKASERLVNSAGYCLRGEIPAAGGPAVRNCWVLTRDSWARNQR
jgi:[ribosomal protein S5]-alanine N-acetyltransferase